MSILRTAAIAALALSAAAFSAQAEQVGNSASATGDVFANGMAQSRGAGGAGGAGGIASSATGSAFAYDLSVSHSLMAGLESSIALSNNASANDGGGAVFGARHLAAR